MKIFTNFSHVVGKFVVTKNCIIMVSCPLVSRRVLMISFWPSAYFKNCKININVNK